MTKPPQAVITWTPALLARLKLAYQEAVLAGLDSFMFSVPEQHANPLEFVTPYARYLIEFLEAKF